MPQRHPATSSTEDEAILRELAAIQINGESRRSDDRPAPAGRRQAIVLPASVPAEPQRPSPPPATEEIPPRPAEPVLPAAKVTVRPEPPAPAQRLDSDKQTEVTGEIRRLVAELQAEKEAELAEKRAKAADPRTILRNRPWLTGEIPSPPRKDSRIRETIDDATDAPAASKRPLRVPTEEAQPQQDQDRESLAESILARRMAAEQALANQPEPQQPQDLAPAIEPAPVEQDDADVEEAKTVEPKTSGWGTTLLIAISAMASAAMVAYLFFM